MASAAQVTLVDPQPGAAVTAERRLRQLEQRWSRFLPDSDLTRISTTPDTWIDVHPDTVKLIATMQAASAATDGGYDPTMLPELVEIGYTASIDDPGRVTAAPVLHRREHTVQDVEIDAGRSRLRVPPGLWLDPGGIGKGFAADLVVTELLRDGTAGALVGIGGDIAAAGRAPTIAGWTVGVEDPLRPPATLATLEVSDGGIATSSTRSRRWLHRGTEHHHTLDPATGEPSATDLAGVTVIATAGWLAEAHATAALVLGSAGAVAYLEARGLTGITVGDDGTVAATHDLDLADPVPGGAR